MRFWEKVYNYFSPRNINHNPLVDAFLEDVMANGELFGFRNYDVLVKVNGKLYSLETLGYPRRDMEYVRLITGFRSSNYTLLYRGRPSRLVHIRFWEWLENREPRLVIQDGRADIDFAYKSSNCDEIELKLLKEFGYHGK